jgi:hypothetical protein
MPLNVPVTLTVAPIDRSFTVHTDRQRWSADQLAAEPDGRAALEAAVREGLSKAASTCAYAGLAEADIDTAEYPDGSVAMTGRVLCDEAECHAAARRHHFDAAESIEAKAAADWATHRELDVAPGQSTVEQERHLSSLRDRERQERRLATRLVIGILLGGAGAAMSLYDYHRPNFASSPNFSVWMGENFDAICNHLAQPVLVLGVVVVLVAIGRGPILK